MESVQNELGQPVGVSLKNWETRPWPPRTPMVGRYCRLEPLNLEAHAQQLYDAHVKNGDDKYWTYLPYGPYQSFEEYRVWIESVYAEDDPQFFAVIEPQSGQAVGVASYLRIEPKVGSIEVGHIHFSPSMQKTPAATEAMFLMMQRAFDELGYRRYEWKCDGLNGPSKRAAQRFGFTPEGVFRQCTMYKGRSRDTAWFSIIDTEWPQRKQMFEAWLNPDNFDADGRQLKRLEDFK